MEDSCKKILLDKKYGLKKIERILRHHKLYESGNKDKLLESVSNNPTIFEMIIIELLKKSLQKQVKKMCETLGIDSNSNVDELKKKISDELKKNIKNKNIKNKIEFLDNAFDKPDLERILKRHDFPKSGNKDKLLEVCARNDFIVKEVMTKWKKSKKSMGRIQDMCETLGMDWEGKKSELLQKIEDYVFKNEIKKDIPNESAVMPTNSSRSFLKSQNSFSKQKIFKSNADGLTEITEKKENKIFDYEKDLQNLIEENVSTIFPELEFISSEFSLRELRVDSVCFNNQTNSFTIIEYKNIKHGGVLDQALAYLDLLEKNKNDFVVLYQQQKDKMLKNPDWKGIKVIVISPEYTPHQLRASDRTRDPIEFYQIKRLHDKSLSVEPIGNRKK
jgi:hypothetical protein